MARTITVDQPLHLSRPGALPTITAQVRGSGGTLESTASGPATIRVLSGPSGAVLGGTLTATVTGGNVSFPGLTVDKVGSYTFAIEWLDGDPFVGFAGTPGLVAGWDGGATLADSAGGTNWVPTSPADSVFAASGLGWNSWEDSTTNLRGMHDNAADLASRTASIGSGSFSFLGCVMQRAVGSAPELFRLQPVSPNGGLMLLSPQTDSSFPAATLYGSGTSDLTNMAGQTSFFDKWRVFGISYDKPSNTLTMYGSNGITTVTEVLPITTTAWSSSAASTGRLCYSNKAAFGPWGLWSATMNQTLFNERCAALGVQWL